MVDRKEMRLSPITAAFVLASFVIAGCGGGAKEAKAPETNPWADYKGTYAQAAEAPVAPTTTAADSKPAEVAAAKPDGSAAAPAAAPRKATGKKAGPKPGAKKRAAKS